MKGKFDIGTKYKKTTARTNEVLKRKTNSKREAQRTKTCATFQPFERESQHKPKIKKTQRQQRTRYVREKLTTSKRETPRKKGNMSPF